MLISPYNTIIGSHVNNRKLELKLSEFLIKGSDTNNLNYEYVVEEDIDLIFITGKNDDERELPVWNHPLYFEDHRGRKKIFTDLRPYVGIKKNEDVVNLDNIVTNKLGFDFNITKVLYMVFMLDEAKGELNKIESSLVMAFTKWVSVTLKSALNLDIETVTKLEVICFHYISSIIKDEELDERTVEPIYFKASKGLKVLRNNIKYIKDTCHGINLNPRNTEDLSNNIRTAIDSPLLGNLNEGTLYSILSTTWTGPHPGENVSMSLEHIPTLIALLSVSMDSKSLKHSRVANILNDNKRYIKNDEFLKTVTLTVSEQKT